jgi:hypothetical protein
MRLVRETTLGQAQIADLQARVARLEGGALSTGAARTFTPTLPNRAEPDRAHGSEEPPSGGKQAGAPAPLGTDAAVAPSGIPADLASTSEASTEATTTSGAPFATTAAWQEHWGALLEAVNRRDRALAGVLRDCRAVEADEKSLTIGAPYRFHLDKLAEPTRVAHLAEAAAEVAGSARSVATTFVGDPAAPARRPGVTGEATQAVLDTFAGSRVTSTRLRENADRAPRGGAA